MHGIRNALGSMGIGKTAPAANPTPFQFKVEMLVQDLILDRMPEKHLARNKFEPYLSIRRNEDKVSTVQTITKKDYNLTTREVVMYNETFVLEFNQDDILNVTLFNDSPILRPDQRVAEGLIQIRELLGNSLQNNAQVGMMLNSQALELPLREVIAVTGGATGTTGTGETKSHTGIVGRLMHPGSHGSTTAATGTGTHGTTAGTSTGAMGSGASTSTSTPATVGVPGRLPAGEVLGRVKLFLKVFANQAITGTGLAGASTASGVQSGMGGQTGMQQSGMGMGTGVGMGVAGGALAGGALASGMHGGSNVGASSVGSGTTGGVHNVDGAKAGLTAFDIFIQGVQLDYSVLQRVFGYSSNDFTNKLKPYVMVSTNGDMITAAKTNTARFDNVKSFYNFDYTVRAYAKPGDRLYFYLIDDNMISRDTTLGVADLPMASFSSLQSSMQELRLNAWDSKWRRDAVPTGMSSAGIIGSVFFNIKQAPADLQTVGGAGVGQQQQTGATTGVGTTGVGSTGHQSAMLAAGQAAHMGQGAVGQVPLTNVQQTKVGSDMRKSEFTEAPGVHVGRDTRGTGAVGGTTGMGQTGLGQTSQSSNLSQASNMSQTSQMSSTSGSSVPSTGMHVSSTGLPGSSHTGLGQTSNIGSSGIGSSGIQSGSTIGQSGLSQTSNIGSSGIQSSGLGKTSGLGSVPIQTIGEPLSVQSGVVGSAPLGQTSSIGSSGTGSSGIQSGLGQTSNIGSSGIQSGSTLGQSGLGKTSGIGSTGVQSVGEPLSIQSGVVGSVPLGQSSNIGSTGIGSSGLQSGLGQPGQVSSSSYSGQSSSLRQSEMSQTSSGLPSDKASSYVPPSQPLTSIDQRSGTSGQSGQGRM